MHALARLHVGGHIYKPGGIGELEYDPTPHLIGSESIVETRDLPGFAERGVTYESHHFWVHFARYAERQPPLTEADAQRRKQFSCVLIRVHHGGGWELWRGDYMLASALARYGSDDRGLFLLCWYMIDNAKTARDVGRHESAQEYRTAFVEGRLKKRKLPARGAVKVWIDPPTAPALSGA